MAVRCSISTDEETGTRSPSQHRLSAVVQRTEGEVNVIRKMLAAAALVVLASCNAPDPNAPADGAAVKNPPVDANPSPKSGTGGDMPVDAGGGASTAGKGKTQ
jgi:hypothetical protein